MLVSVRVKVDNVCRLSALRGATENEETGSARSHLLRRFGFGPARLRTLQFSTLPSPPQGRQSRFLYKKLYVIKKLELCE